MKKKSKLFRSKMGGYKKDDVNKYILDMNTAFSDKEDEYLSEKSKLDEKIKQQEIKIDELCKVDFLRFLAEKQLSDSEAECADLKNKINSYETEISEIKEKLTLLESLLDEKDKLIKKLEMSICQKEAEISALVDKQKKFNESNVKKASAKNSIFGLKTSNR